MSTRKNLSYNLINQITAVLFPFITVPYVSRVLGVENIGIIGFSNAFTGYFTVLAALGVSIYGSREIAKYKNDKLGRSKLFSELFFIMIISSLICSIFFLISIYSVTELNEKKEFLLLTGISLYLSSFSLDWFFAGRENFKLITIRSVSVKIICLLLMFVFVKTKVDALIFCGIGVLAGLLNNLWNFTYLIRKEVTISFKKLKIRIHLKSLFTLLATNLAISFYTALDTIMLGFISGFTEVGYYNSATKISRLLLPFAIVTTSVMIPKISYAFSQKDKQQYNHYLKESFSLVAFFATPMAVGLFVITPSFVPLFFGNEFLPVIPVLQILSSVLFFVGLSNYFGIQILVTSGYESKLLVCILLGAIVNFTLNILLIPKFGSLAAASTSVIAELIILLATIYVTLKTVKISIDWIFVIQSSLSTIPIIIIHLLLTDELGIYKLLIIIPIGGILYFMSQILIFKSKVAIELITKLTNTLKINIKWI